MPRGSAALRKPRQRLQRVSWLLAVPAGLALLLFHFLPVGFGGYFAFTDWNGLTHARWIGLANFREIAHDTVARGAVWHTVELAACFVVAVNAIGLALALGLNRAIKTRHVLRALFFAPVALSPPAIAFIWQWIFSFGGGLNTLLGDLGLASLERPWTASPGAALWVILVVLTWQYSGLAMVLYLAGLESVSAEIYDATLVDGASSWFRFRKVVLPLLAPAMTVSA